jgi:N-methylhydantoinase A
LTRRPGCGIYYYTRCIKLATRDLLGVSWLVGVDVGGTFTDFFAYDARACRTRSFKIPSTPRNPAAAIAEGLREMCEAFDIDSRRVSRLCHGTTVATNALIQRKGATVALITTSGFRDLLEIGRQTRPHLYSFQIDHPEPLVPRQRRFEIRERITDGPKILLPLDDSSLRQAVATVKQSGADSCAVCLLFSFLDDAHERKVGEALARSESGLMISLSSEVQPEFREYERFSTTVLNAYLQPVMARYLSYLEERLTRDAPAAKVGIYQSSGGLMSIDTARRFPVRTALSGPAAGVVGGIHSARSSQQPNVITLDMGGTSADVALIRDYAAGLSFDRAVAGFPIRLPMVDIHTVGAGGGSIAWFDRDGLLKVGPLSAGADPGPACYGKGGKSATVTDANLVLGRLSPRGLIGGRMPLLPELARAAIKPIAERLGFSLERTALGIVEIVAANMVRAIRTVSVERGHDPRNYALLPFGGAGPLHASEVARVLGISRCLIPAAPGILCAQGLIASELKDDIVRSARIRLDKENLGRIRGILQSLMTDAEAWFARESVKLADRKVAVSFDMRYVGQNFELAVPMGPALGGKLPRLDRAEKLRSRFFAVHDQFYGFHNDSDPVEIINVRLTASAALTTLKLPKIARSRTSPLKPFEYRRVWFTHARPTKTPVYDRAGLGAGHTIAGPAIIEQLDSTTVLYPGDRANADGSGHLLVAVGP